MLPLPSFSQTVPSTRSDPLQIVSRRAWLYGRGACADFTLKSAALIKPNPTEWHRAAPSGAEGYAMRYSGAQWVQTLKPADEGYVYYASAFANLRVKSTFDAIVDPAQVRAPRVALKR